MEQKPSIGRIVHYQRWGTPGNELPSEPSPAIIVKVHEDDACDIVVFNPNGQYFNNKCQFSAEPRHGHWNWPPRV